MTLTNICPQASLTGPLRRHGQALADLRASIAAWQEASVGIQASGLMLSEVRVNVGDSVRRGQVLAVFDAAPVAAALAHSRAALAEAEAALGKAVANGQRARELQASGTLSAQQINQNCPRA